MANYLYVYFWGIWNIIKQFYLPGNSAVASKLRLYAQVCRTFLGKCVFYTVYANYIGLLVMTDANCEGFPIRDDRITENDRCVIKIIGIHCL